MFIGRTEELRQLNALYRTGKFHFLVMYGRHGVGKSALLSEFVNQKPYLFFTAAETNDLHNLSLFLNYLQKASGSRNLANGVDSFETALEAIFQFSTQQQIILVLDNYPFLHKSAKNISVILQKLIQKYRTTSKLFLILCGSGFTSMEKLFLEEKAPFYQLPTCKLCLEPFDYFESCHFFRRFSSTDAACIYGMTGGVPKYLLQFNDKLTLEENVKQLFLNPLSPLYNEPANLLGHEVREQALYTAILSILAEHSCKMAEIHTRIQEETSVCTAYLKSMLAMGIVKKETPVAESSVKKTIYRISDPIFRFWYRFMPEQFTNIICGQTQTAWLSIKSQMNDFMQDVFEDICRQYLANLHKSQKAPFDLSNMGRWWGYEPKTNRKISIDILATCQETSALFGCCRWNDEPVDSDTVEQLITDSSSFPQKEKYYYIFSKNGFTKQCKDMVAEQKNIVLISFSK